MCHLETPLFNIIVNVPPGDTTVCQLPTQDAYLVYILLWMIFWLTGVDIPHLIVYQYNIVAAVSFEQLT